MEKLAGSKSVCPACCSSRGFPDASQPFCRRAGCGSSTYPHVRLCGSVHTPEVILLLSWRRGRRREEVPNWPKRVKSRVSQMGLARSNPIGKHALPEEEIDQQDRICHVRAATIRTLLYRIHCQQWRGWNGLADGQFLNWIDQLLVSSLDPVSLPIAKGGKAVSPLMLSKTSSEEYN